MPRFYFYGAQSSYKRNMAFSWHLGYIFRNLRHFVPFPNKMERQSTILSPRHRYWKWSPQSHADLRCSSKLQVQVQIPLPLSEKNDKIYQKYL